MSESNLDYLKEEVSSSDVEELNTVVEMLNLIIYRNKNQHRRSQWFRSVTILRKQLKELVDELNRLQTGGNDSFKLYYLEHPEERKKLEKRLDARYTLFRDTWVLDWYTGFSQLIADPQFGSTGLVLLASVARMSHLLGIEFKPDDTSSPSYKEFMESGSKTAEEIFGNNGYEQDGEDFGEVIQRED